MVLAASVELFEVVGGVTDEALQGAVGVIVVGGRPVVRKRRGSASSPGRAVLVGQQSFEHLALSHRLVVGAHRYECNHARRTECSS